MTTNNNATTAAQQAQKNAQKAYERIRDEMDDSPGSRLLAVGILAILCSLALKVIVINIAPYLIVMGSTPLPSSNLPIVGWAWDLLNVAYTGTGAFIAWFLVQLAQVMWILIALDRKAHRAAIRASQKEKEYQDAAVAAGEVGKREERHIKKMKRRAVRLPFFFVAAAGWIALSAYVIESVVNFKAYPAVKNWGEFLAGLTIGDLSPINWNNVGMQAWGLFSTEIVVVAIIVVWQWVSLHRKAANP
jgi:hypothetical protein